MTGGKWAARCAGSPAIVLAPSSAIRICSVCWVDAPVMAAKMVVDIKSDVLKSGHELKFTESTEVRFSCNEMPVDRLLAFLKLAHPEGRISKPAAEAKT